MSLYEYLDFSVRVLSGPSVVGAKRCWGQAAYFTDAMKPALLSPHHTIAPLACLTDSGPKTVPSNVLRLRSAWMQWRSSKWFKSLVISTFSIGAQDLFARLLMEGVEAIRERGDSTLLCSTGFSNYRGHGRALSEATAVVTPTA